MRSRLFSRAPRPRRPKRYFIPSLGSANVTLALTGQSATSAPGSVVQILGLAVSGQSASSAQGSIANSSGLSLSGIASTSAQGTAVQSAGVGLGGQEADSAAGSVGINGDVTETLGSAATAAGGAATGSSSVALLGQSAASSAGTVTAATGAVAALSGSEADSASGTPAASISIGLTGAAAVVAAGNINVLGTGSAADVWAYVLANGKTAGQNLVENNSMLQALTGAIEGSYTIFDLLKIIAAVAAGQTTINPHGGGAATVEFEAVDESGIRVSAEMQGSERTSVTLTP